MVEITYLIGPLSSPNITVVIDEKSAANILPVYDFILYSNFVRYYCFVRYYTGDEPTISGHGDHKLGLSFLGTPWIVILDGLIILFLENVESFFVFVW